LRLNDDVDGDGRRESSRGGEGTGRRLRGKVIVDYNLADFFLVSWGGVRLSLRGMSATTTYLACCTTPE
jgi:hypothetical protein